MFIKLTKIMFVPKVNPSDLKEKQRVFIDKDFCIDPNRIESMGLFNGRILIATFSGQTHFVKETIPEIIDKIIVITESCYHAPKK